MAHWPDRLPVTDLTNAIMIERRAKLDPNETMARHLAGEGRPVVVTDAQDSWKAKKLWSLDYFKKHYANESLIASDRAPLRSEDNPKMTTLRTTLGEFIDYMQQPNHAIAAQERDCPFYGNSWSPFMEHERLRGHISRPYFVPDDIPSDGEHQRLDRSFTKIFLGPAGTITRIHNDTYHTHAWLSQIRGTKQFILYPPSQAYLIHAGEGVASSQEDSPRCHTKCAQTWFDPLAPDFVKFPRAAQATPYIAVCEPGDTILVPSDWFHYAVALTPSITLMRNFMNEANVGPFLDVWNANQAGNNRPKPPPPPMSPIRIPPPALPPSISPPTDPATTTTSAGTTLNSLPPLLVPRPDGSVGPQPLQMSTLPTKVRTPSLSGECSPRSSDAVVEVVSVDDSRQVSRQHCTAHAARIGMGSGYAHAGTERLAVYQLDVPCSRRAVTAWCWSGTRRADMSSQR